MYDKDSLRDGIECSGDTGSARPGTDSNVFDT